MSLVRLLTTGKSLVGMRDTASRYRMNKQGVLPKFISPKNPFAPPAGSGTERGTAVVQSLPAAATDPADLKKTQKLPPVADSATAEKPLRPARSAPVFPESWGSWLREKTPLSFVAGSKRAPEPVRMGSTREPVQDELSLDRVTVVRNDLSDADLEVVPAKLSAAKDSAEPVLPFAARAEPAATPWGRLTTRFFGARAT